MIWIVYTIVPILNQRFYTFSKETAVREKKSQKKKNNHSLSEQNDQQIQEVMMFNECCKPSLYPHGYTFTTPKLGK